MTGIPAKEQTTQRIDEIERDYSSHRELHGIESCGDLPCCICDDMEATVVHELVAHIRFLESNV